MSRNTSREFSSIIIGSGSLPIRCAETILKKGHKISAIVSSDLEVISWSRKNAILLFDSIGDFGTGFAASADFLFSINNEHILNPDILRLATGYAINYHDSLLPRYAGTHATSWALMNGEKEHGISWHLIADKVDAGDVLKQRAVEVANDETALSLNTKCYEAAILAFDELVDELSADSVVVEKQDLSQRSFFPRYKRLGKGGILSWDQEAEQISRLVRALDFGNYPNALGRAKFAIEGEFFVVQKVEVLETLSSACPGTIDRIGDELIQVACADKDVAIKAISTIDGLPISISELAGRFQLRRGYRLVDVENETTERIDDLIKEVARSEHYWIEKLSKFDPVNAPYSQPSRSDTGPDYVRLPMELPDEFLAFIDWSSGDGRFQLSLLAAFGALLSRLTGMERFSIGYTDRNLKRSVGDLGRLFATTVPLGFDVKPLGSLPSLIGFISQEVDQVRTEITYLRDVRSRFPKLGLKNGNATIRLLPVTFAEIDEIEAFLPPTVVDLVLAVSNRECFWIFNSSVLDISDVEKISGHLQMLLESFVAHQDQEIAKLSILTALERNKVLYEWNADRLEVVPDKCLHHFFEEQVERTPGATALIVGDRRLSYRELNAKANRVASHLQGIGAGPEVLVAICVDRSVEAIVGILGILKAGAAYVPLDPAYPQDRLHHMLNDSRAAILLTKRNVEVELGPHNAAIANLDLILDVGEESLEANPSSAVKINNLAYVIYTSGSTGKPKGVAIEHHSTATFLTWATSVFSTDQLKGTLASTSFCFDLSVFEMFAPLSCGGAIVLVENILHFPNASAAVEVTLINTVPSAISELVRINRIPNSVKTVNLAGEPLKTSLVKQIYATGSVEKVFDLYGPTEDTTYSTYTLRGVDKATIGRPISNTQSYILDSNRQPVPIGIPGELYLGGDGVARGYLNQPELTAERFLNISFDSGPSKRVYRTGDVVRYLSTGEIEYLGRIDNQVKIRGFRIELGEIESVIGNFKDVQETVVQAIEDAAGTKKLVAYVVSVEHSTIKTADLRRYVATKLPEYMVPSVFVQLDRMPLTPNGKIDRKVLPVPEANRVETSDEYEAPTNATEVKLSKIWSEVLGVEKIGVRDNFFELGGHSLTAIRMFAEVEASFGKNIPLGVLFGAGTIEKLAEILRKEGWSEPESSLVPIQPNGTKPPFFCIHAKGGNVLFYKDLAKHLGEDQPFYGIQARRLGGRQVGHATVEEMAEFYISEIKSLQPTGPYYIGGSSFGGLAAIEIAQQLRQLGDEVAFLALLDTGTPDYPKLLSTTRKLRAKTHGLFRRFQLHRDSLAAFDSTERRKYVGGKFAKLVLKYKRRINRVKTDLRLRYLYRYQLSDRLPENYVRIEDQIEQAGLNYKPKSYSGKMTLFRASNQPIGIVQDPTLGWDRYVTGGIEIHEVPGYHGSIVVEPFVKTLAEKLSECLKTSIIETSIGPASETLPVISPARSKSASVVASV